MKKRPKRAAEAAKPLGRPKDLSKREGIARAATALFMKDGYELTSMEAVAKKADVSKLTIYSHFANKQELFEAVIQRRCDRLALPQCFAALSRMRPELALSQIGGTLATLIFSQDFIRLQRILQAEAKRHPQIVEIFYNAGPRRVKAAFGDLLKSWNDAGQIMVADTAIATEQFFSLLKGEMYLKTLLFQASKPGVAGLNAHVRAVVAFFLAAYRSKTKN